MKHAPYGTAVSLGLTLILSTMIPAQSGMMGQRPMGQSEGTAESSPGGMMGMMGRGGMGMMGPQTMRGMKGGHMQGTPEEMGVLRPSQLVRMLKAELGLSDEQVKQLTSILSQATKARIKQRADLGIAEFELGELLEAEAVDMGHVEGKLKAIEGLRTTLRLSLIKAHEQAKGVLTPEQRQKLEHLHDRLPGMMGSGMMSMMEMMGESASSGMGTMGSMGGQPQSPVQMAGSPQNLTQEDKQGAVTVSATLLTPDRPRADGTLAVRVKLDTHAVGLDQYQPERLALLRDAQGREIQALGLESPSGSGHHRAGVLTFPGTDASGKPLLSPEAKSLTLILRGIGGVQERVFRWQLPLG